MATVQYIKQPTVVDTKYHELMERKTIVADKNSPDPRLFDSQWIHKTIRRPMALGDVDPFDRNRANVSSATFKSDGTSLGSNVAINPLPAFTPAADIPDTGFYPYSREASIARLGPNESHGMGTYYAEAFDDNKRVIHLAFGVPQYNSFFGFFGGFYTGGMADVARTGRAPKSFAASVGSLIRGVLNVCLAPINFVVSGVAMISNFYSFIMGHPVSAYYNIKPTMHTYWSTVSVILNQILINEGLLRYYGKAQDGERMTDNASIKTNINEGKLKGEIEDEKNYLNLAQSLNPAIMDKNGRIDVFAMVLANRQREITWRNALNLLQIKASRDVNGEKTIDQDVYFGYVNDFVSGKEVAGISRKSISNALNQEIEKSAKDKTGKSGTGMNLESYWQRWLDFKEYSLVDMITDVATDGSATREKSMEYDPYALAQKEIVKAKEANYKANTDQDKAELAKATRESSLYNEYKEKMKKLYFGMTDSISTSTLKFANYYNAAVADGGEWASFRVDDVGTVSESFSNGVTNNTLAEKINGIGAGFKDLSINLAGAGFKDGFIANTLGALAESVTGAVGLDGIFNALGGGAVVDIPKHWSESSAGFTKNSYNITLYCPYNNPLSRTINIYVPLAMLLAGALPLATGKHSHTAPFMCTLFDRGRSIVRTGMITSLSVTRGEGNQGWDRHGKALTYKVSFEITDMNTIMAVPVMNSFLGNLVADLFSSQESPFQDYLLTIGAVDLRNSFDKAPTLMRQLNKSRAQIGGISAANMAMWFSDGYLGNINRIFNNGTSRQ